MNTTHQSYMVELECYARSRVDVPLVLADADLAVVANDNLRIISTMPTTHANAGAHTRIDAPPPDASMYAPPKLNALERTWCWCPGTSAVVNCARLYSRSAGRIPVCRVSSSEMMFRTSVGGRACQDRVGHAGGRAHRCGWLLAIEHVVDLAWGRLQQEP